MQTLIMISNADITVADLANALTPQYTPIRLDAACFSIQRTRPNRTTAYVRVRSLDNPETQYDDGDHTPFAVGPETRGFLIEFNDLSLLKEVVPLLADRSDIAIDDDHGSILPGRDFVVGLQASTVLGWLAPDYET